jgi:hypothetical protein
MVRTTFVETFYKSESVADSCPKLCRANEVATSVMGLEGAVLPSQQKAQQQS